jgi:agmatinase
MKIPFIESTFISASASFPDSRIVILGCPFDGTASFHPGARFGPGAIRRASWGIETFSPYCQRDLNEFSVHDMGDLELPLGEKQAALGLIRKAIRPILSRKKFPILLGGDHLITLPVIDELLRIHPDLRLLHIDAHADLRDDYLGETLSHSTVMRRAIEHLGSGRLFQLGIRSGTKEEFGWAKKMRSIVGIDQGALIEMVRGLKDRPVYLSLDLDAIDPSIIPGVGTPEPGGFTFQEFISILHKLHPLRVIGFDIVELTPDYDPTQVSSLTASVILREMILTFCPPKAMHPASGRM